MTALRKYEKLEATALWRETLATQRREVYVSFGDTSLVIRNQADDLRRMRRERAMGVAHALPVKLVFPLVICFLPAIFLAALGPAFAKFVNQIDSIVR